MGCVHHRITLPTYMVVLDFFCRLGPVGFLTFENDLAPGNLGLRDQVRCGYSFVTCPDFLSYKLVKIQLGNM